MHGESIGGSLYIIIVILYSFCAISTFYSLLTGFYVTVNPERYTIFHYLADHWRKVFLTMIPLVILFWFTASYSAVYCKVEYESYSAGSGYYFHKMSLFLPACGNVGSWSYGQLPPSSIPGLTIGSLTPDSERVILRNSLAFYLIGLAFINALVINYLITISRQKNKQLKLSEEATVKEAE